MIDWDDIRFFLAVARRGSITAASRDLGVNHSTVSRRIAGFEESLGTRLFDRVSSGYELSQAGREMMPIAQRMEEDALTVDRQFYGRDTELEGLLKVTTAGPFVNEFFMTQLDLFLKDYPGVEIELIVSVDAANLHAREVDVAMRVTNNPPETLVGRRLARMVAMVYAHEDMLAPGEPGAGEDALAPCVISFTDAERDIMNAPWFKDTYPNAKRRAKMNDVEAVYHAVRNGLGIGMLPCFLGDMDPDIRRMPPYRKEEVFDLWLLTHPDLRRSAKVRAFMNFMAEAIAPHKDLIEGRAIPENAAGVPERNYAYDMEDFLLKPGKAAGVKA